MYTESDYNIFCLYVWPAFFFFWMMTRAHNKMRRSKEGLFRD